MVKRDRLLAVMLWLPWALIVLDLLLVLFLLYKLFSTWSSLDFLGRGGTIFVILCLLFALPKTVRSVLKEGGTRQWKRVEALRMNPQKASLYQVQPEVAETTLVLPAVLRVRLSGAIYLGFMVLWLLVAGVGLFAGGSSLGNGLFLLLWMALGGMIIGLTGVLMYQRIEITEQALVVQKGLKRRKMPWGQARLFAALRVLDRKGMPVLYELSSASMLLRWNAFYPPGFGFVTYPPGKAAYEQLLAELLAYTHARTDLPLLDLR